MNFLDFCYEFTHTESGLNQLLRNAFSIKKKKRNLARKLIALDCPILLELLGEYDPLLNSQTVQLKNTDNITWTIDFKNVVAYQTGNNSTLTFHINNKESKSNPHKKQILIIYGHNWKCRFEKNDTDKNLVAIVKVEKYHKFKYYVS
jgi:hypothetical protein